MAAVAGSALAVGVVLDRLSDRVEGMIRTWGQEGRGVTLSVGAELRNTIDSVRATYIDCLEKTCEEAGREVSSVINQIEGLVDRAQQRNDAALRQLASQAQVIASTLPLHNSCPQVRSVTPRFMVLLQPDRRVYLDIFGHFEHAGTRNCPHTLTFNEHQANLIQTSIGKLRFEMRFDQIFPENSLRQELCVFSTGQLRAAWPGVGLMNRAIGVWQHLIGGVAPEERVFNVTVGALPSSPGKLSLLYTPQKVVTEEQPHSSGAKHVDSCRQGARYEPNQATGGHNRGESMDFFEAPSPGWKVRLHTKRFSGILTPNGGVNTHLEFLHETENGVAFRCSTEHSKTGHSGIIDFCVKFIEERDVVKDDPEVSEDINIKWGEMKTFKPARSWKKDGNEQPMWKVVFQPFDADQPEVFTTTGESERLKIEPDGLGFKIIAKVPQELADS